MEVKVDQVYRHEYPCEVDVNIISGKATVMSDLEIVQKALLKKSISLIPDAEGFLVLDSDGVILQKITTARLLTWAKQTIGESPAPEGE